MVAITLEPQAALQDITFLRASLEGESAAHGFTRPVDLAAFVRRDGVVMGGVYGELRWDWLYIDLLWVDDSMRGQGMGQRLVQAIEQAALARSVERVYLATTSFQALPFYHHLGYTLFGALEDRPPGYNFYYLKKPIWPVENDALLEVTDAMTREDFDALRNGLRDYVIGCGVAVDSRRLSVMIRADDGTLLGGLTGVTAWGWFDLQTLWLDELARGHGFGSQVLATAEQEAAARGCPHVVIDIPDVQYLEFFHKRGYVTFATLPDRPAGYVTHFLRKDLPRAYTGWNRPLANG